MASRKWRVWELDVRSGRWMEVDQDYSEADARLVAERKRQNFAKHEIDSDACGYPKGQIPPAGRRSEWPSLNVAAEAEVEEEREEGSWPTPEEKRALEADGWYDGCSDDLIREQIAQREFAAIERLLSWKLREYEVRAQATINITETSIYLVIADSYRQALEAHRGQ